MLSGCGLIEVAKSRTLRFSDPVILMNRAIESMVSASRVQVDHRLRPDSSYRLLTKGSTATVLFLTVALPFSDN